MNQNSKPNPGVKAEPNRQASELEAIKERLALLEQNSPLQDILESIFLELGRNLNEISDLRENQVDHAKGIKSFHTALFDLKDKVNRKNVALQEELEMTRLENETAKNQLKRYRDERNRLEAMVKHRDYENDLFRQDMEKLVNEADLLRRDIKKFENEADYLRRDIFYLENLLSRLHLDFKILLVSRRWKIGNALVDFFYTITLRKKEHSNAAEMKKHFNAFEQWQQIREAKIMNGGISREEEEKAGSNPGHTATLDPAATTAELNTILQEVCTGLEQLLKGRRWKLGHFLGSIIFFPFSRGQVPPELVVFNDLLARNRQQYSSGTLNDLQGLDKMIAELESAYRSLLSSRRWIIGSFFVALINTLLFRDRHNPVTEQITYNLTRYHARRRQLRHDREETVDG